MEAKDTVINYKRIQEIDLKNAESNFTDALWDVAREQAEISFKAGQEDVVRLTHPYFQAIAKDSKQAGMEVVVEWVKENAPSVKAYAKHSPFNEPIWAISQERWQDQLKKWGIE